MEMSGRQIEQLVDELILSTNILAANPPRLPLPDPVYRFVSLNRSPRRLELAKVLLGLHSSFDGSMIQLQDIVQILDRSMATAAAEDSFLLHCWNRRAVEACLIGVDDPGLWMGWIAESLAKTAVWQPQHLETLTAGSRWWHLWNRWPDRGNTNGPSPEHRFHRHARI